MIRIRAFLLPPAALALLPACLPTKPNFGLNSVHQPVVAGGRASVPGCPDWSSAGIDSAAMTDSNFGCATNTNLAAMIADPNDLIRGRSAGATTSTEAATRAIKAWREAEPTSKQWVTTTRKSVGGGGGGGSGSSGGPR